ncbi:MAG: TonB-dependent receptor plug domain-containing protein, partial [Bacteroidota bacterium]
FILSAILLLSGSFLFSQTPAEEQQADTLEIERTRESELPVISIEDIEEDNESQDISSLLQGSRDIYVSTAGYNFGVARYRIRGYQNENTMVMINGIPVNDPETGRPFYSIWGGLNDAMRMTVSYNGIGHSPENFGNLGGATNITTRASLYSNATRLTYSNSNRSYVHRAMFTHSTGMQDNGWALTLSGSRRLAQEGYVEGTFYDAWAYFVSAERKLNNKHSIGFIAFGAPSTTGRPGVATQEAYNLTGNNYYNPNWGFQNGKKRNARVNSYHTPWLMLNHYFDVTPDIHIQTSAGYTFGKGSSTALNWTDAYKPSNEGEGGLPVFSFEGHDPRPDYYRYLPSYYQDDPYNFNKFTELWLNDPTFTQLNWDKMYQYNMKNLFTQTDVNGIEGNSVTGNRSIYMVESRRNDRSQFVFNSFAKANLNPTTTLSGGINVSLAKTRQYKLVDDLLGGDWWLDIDQFALRDADDPDFAQNDLDNPNRLVTEGDTFGYDYTGNINEYNLFAQSNWILPRWDFYLAANVSQTTFWRTGHMRNGRFPDNSLGESEKQNFTNFGLKGGTTFKFTGRHYFTANAAYLTRAPYFRNAYISARVRDDLVPVLNNETIMSGDVSYLIRSPFIKSRLTLFYTDFRDKTWSRSFYHEEYRTFVNYNMYGVDQTHMGVELGMDIKLSPSLELSLVGGTGDYVYSSRPTVNITRDNDRELLAQERTVYWENYKVGGLTHTAASAGLRYNSSRYWFIGTNLNYFDDIYIDINPDRRTAEAISGFVDTDPGWQQVIDQEKMQSAITLDVFGGKSWRIRREYFINLNMSVSNVLDNREFAMGGFEQLRYDSNSIDSFPSKYFYLYGRTFFINLSFRM